MSSVDPRSSLLEPAGQGHLEIPARNASQNDTWRSHWNSLVTAGAHGDINSVVFLLAHGGTLPYVDVMPHLLLIMASRAGKSDVIRAILSAQVTKIDGCICSKEMLDLFLALPDRDDQVVNAFADPSIVGLICENCSTGNSSVEALVDSSDSNISIPKNEHSEKNCDLGQIDVGLGHKVSDLSPNAPSKKVSADDNSGLEGRNYSDDERSESGALHEVTTARDLTETEGSQCMRQSLILKRKGLLEANSTTSTYVRGNFNLNLTTALIVAAGSGQAECVELLLRAGSKMIAERVGVVALLDATALGHAECVRELLAAGVDPNSRNSYDVTALMFAAAEGRRECVKTLLQAGADMNMKDKCNSTALMNATFHGNVTIVRDLLLAGANVNVEDDNGRTALSTACVKGRLDCILNLKWAGADVNHINRHGSSPLMTTVENDDFACMLALLAGKASTEIVNKRSRTALSIAAKLGHVDCLRALWRAGSSVEHSDTFGVTPLLEACRHGHVECVRELVVAKADLQRVVLGTNCLEVATVNGHLGCVDILLAGGAKVNTKGRLGPTPLFASCRHEHPDCLQSLLRAGAEVNAERECGTTALLLAAHEGRVTHIRMLLEAGANVNHQNRNGYGALYLASRTGHLQIVSELIQYGADVSMPTKTKCTALIASAENGHAECVVALLSARANVNDTRNDGVSPLISAAKYGHHKCLDALLRNGAHVDLASADGSTALMAAAHGNHAQCLRSLLEASASVNTRNGARWTALMYAAASGSAECMKLLLQRNAEVIPSTLLDEYESALTPFMLTALYCNVDGLQLLLDCARHGQFPGVFIWVNVDDGYGWTPLAYAVMGGDAACTLALLEAGADVNHQGKHDGRTALMIAVQFDREKCVETLLEAKPNLDLVDSYGYSALSLAAHFGHDKYLNSLLSAGAEVNMCAADYSWYMTVPPIQASVQSGHVTCLQTLLEAGADIQSPILQDDLIRIALEGKYSQCLRVLIDAGIAPGHTALNAAVQYYDANTFETILGAAKIHTGSPIAKNIFLAAINKENVDCLKTILKLYSITYSGFKAHVHLVIRKEKIACLQCLLEGGLDANSHDNLLWPLLAIAAYKNQPECIRLLVAAGAETEYKCPVVLHRSSVYYGTIPETPRWTPLSIAVFHDCHEAIKALLEAGADVNSAETSEAACTALMVAASEGHCQSIQLLLDAGAQVNKRNRYSTTALMMACAFDNAKAAQMLLEAGAEVNLRNIHGTNALMLAAKRQTDIIPKTEISSNVCLETLLASGADPNSNDNNSMSSLMLSVLDGDVSKVEALLKAGARPDYADERGKTALMLAAKSTEGETHDIYNLYSNDLQAKRSSFLEILHKIIAYGADPNLTDNNNKSPLMFSVLDKNADKVQALLNAGATVDIADTRGRTALMLAAGKGHCDCVKAILPFNKDPTNLGKSLILAKRHDHKDCFEMLAAQAGRTKALQSLLISCRKLDRLMGDDMTVDLRAYCDM